MIEKSKGIVLHTLLYKDNMSIVHLYTEKYGAVACFLPSSRGKRSLIRSNLFQPFSVLELEIDFKQTRDVFRIKEAKIAIPLMQIPYNPVKSAIALFLSEFLFRVIREKEENISLYQFVENAIQILELSERGVANFHLVFLIRLTAYLGFYPNTDSLEPDSCFDALNGVFTRVKPFHGHFFSNEQSLVFIDVLKMNFETMDQFTYSRGERQNIISLILEYYRLHVPSFPEIKSLEVLKTLF